jgi:hypothetical protein
MSQEHNFTLFLLTAVGRGPKMPDKAQEVKALQLKETQTLLGGKN